MRTYPAFITYRVSGQSLQLTGHPVYTVGPTKVGRTYINNKKNLIDVLIIDDFERLLFRNKYSI